MSPSTWRDSGVPPEILLMIVSYALAQYIDDVTVGPFAFQVDMSTELSYDGCLVRR